MKKDESLALIKKLSKAQVDTSQFQSARQLGKLKHGPIETRRKPNSAESNEPASKKRTASQAYHSDESDSEEDAALSRNTNTFQTSVITPIGSGLKRPLEIGQDGSPIIKRRKRAPKPKPVVQPEPEWEGFDSESSNSESEVDEKDKDAETSSGESSESEPESSSAEGDSESESDDDNEVRPKIRARQSAFKSWAVQQVNEAAGFKPLDLATLAAAKPAEMKIQNQKPRAVVEEEPLPQELRVTTGDPNRKAFAVQVKRSEGVQAARLELPVVGEEQKIMEAIYNNSCVVVCGATGSGKTTQVPQFLFEAGYGSPDSPNPGMIGVTQPRRVAAVSMAKRVGDELGEHSSKVSYQIRFDSTVSNNTAIKFMTDGVLIREIAQDFSLSKYSVIVIDEAHERSVNTDILIGMVSRIVDLRTDMSANDPSVKPLKLVIMSATLRISDFLQNPNLFKQGPPLVEAEGRQYPVTIHFARRTHRDYVEEAFRKVSRGHRKLPPGGFLVFLTGQAEIKHLAKKLKAAFRSTQGSDHIQGKVQMSAAEVPLEAEDIDLGLGVQADSIKDGEEDSDVEIRGLDNDDDEFDEEEGAVESGTKVHVLPLYSQLPTKEQLKIFEPVPQGSRLIVLATNVAETSLTIPGIRYVFDCGRSKEKQYNVETGVQSFEVGWISKASAGQRAGRAGRTGPGHCYRLYSSAVYEDAFLQHSVPEILRTPIEGVVLQMKSMGLHHVINFPFPTPPDRVALAKAEKLLKNLGALAPDGQVTETGRHLTLYPLSPRYGKMLQIGHQHGCMPYVIALVSALTVSELFIQENQIDLGPVEKDENDIYTNADRLEDTAREQRKKDFNRSRRIFSKYDDKTDALKFLAAVCAYAYATNGEQFCNQMFLRPNAMKEAAQLRRQLSDLVRANNPGLLGKFENRLPEPSEKQIRALKQITAAGFIDQIAIRADMAPVPPDMPAKHKRAIDVPYLTLFPTREGRGGDLDEIAVYIHPSSILARATPSELPQYLVYSHLQQSTSSFIGEKSAKVRMFPLTAVSGLQISALAHGTPLLEYGKPIGKIESFGGSPERRECWVIPSLVGGMGTTGWPLPAKKVVQKKDKKLGWVIERFVK